MSELVEIECPKCGRKWSMDYAELQHYRTLYKAIESAGAGPGSTASAPQEGEVRIEEYSVRCPNPAHGEEVIVTLEVSGTDD